MICIYHENIDRGWTRYVNCCVSQSGTTITCSLNLEPMLDEGQVAPWGEPYTMTVQRFYGGRWQNIQTKSGTVYSNGGDSSRQFGMSRSSDPYRVRVVYTNNNETRYSREFIH
ncbi:hypothetical protein GCM10007971_25680 [Oceanobacillus indicireducens]|uniref:Uncharacterized protein n=1 Tax=Oceanobacillus indicireducens TaxID=1004261 RepID=A0A918D2Z0_9BACI|nr:hypothetical protein GCM10007971_25680 [Oceanobacillus indicireducens]